MLETFDLRREWLLFLQHYDEQRVTQVFRAWKNVCRDRGSIRRRLMRCWEGWRTFAIRKKKTEALKKKAVSFALRWRAHEVHSSTETHLRQ